MGVQPSLRHIGKYEVIDIIGTGGMGIVFRAHDPAIGRTVAIKMLRQNDPGAVTGVFDRFFSREMKSTGSLHHKNIVTVYDSGDQDGNPYLVMEYLEGDALSKHIAERRPVPLVEKLDVIVQICDGLQYAHDHNIIHRDIKPANIILLADGTAKIVDFGVARVAGGESTIVQAGQLVGSLYYLSPEQINSLPVDGRTDIFSTGVLLYEFLTHELPFKGADPASTFVKILTEEPPPLSQFVRDIPAAMQTVLNRALAKNVNDRYQTAEELGFEILSVRKHLTTAIIADCMTRAEAAMQRHDLERVRVHLLEVIRLDRQHERANRLLRDVRKAIQQEQRSSQIVQMRSQAQVALAGGQYEEALACADQALKLDPSDKESARLSQEIRAAIVRARAVRETLNRAESALFAGDFDEAREAVEESLRLDPADSEARALASVVNKELAERSRRQRVQDFVDRARRGIAERNFVDAVDALHQAGDLDPADSNIHELLQWAERGQQQEKHRKDLQEITDQIEKALRAGDFSSACTISEMGLQRVPDDPTLARLRAISEKQRDIAQRRRFVQDQSLAVKILTDQGRLAEAIATLALALKKYPGEPNLESLLALTRAQADRLRLEREEAERREEMQRAEEEARVQQAQRVLSSLIEMRRSLDARVALDSLSGDAAQLRGALENPGLDEHAKNAAALVLEEVGARLRARDQAIAELDQFRLQVEQVQNVASLADGDNRLRSIKATFPNEKKIQNLCSELGDALSRLRDEHDRRISVLTSLTQSVDFTPVGELQALRQKARELAAGFADDARIGVLLQQIESSVSDRLEAQTAHAHDIETLFADLSRARSLQELARMADRSKSIAALDRTDENLASRAAQFQSEVSRLRTLLESSLNEMSSLADKVAAAATIDDAEAVVPTIRAFAARQPDFQDLQEAATRLLAQIHGRRIEHDLIVQELESARATLPTIETQDDLSATAARAAECRALHPSDPTILTLAAEIESTVEGILRERAHLRERTAACDAALQAAEEHLRTNNPGAAVEALLAVEVRNPDRADLHQKIAAAQKQLEQFHIERQRQEQERIAKEKAEVQRREQQRISREKAEAEHRKQLRAAKEEAEAERLEQESIAKEKAAAEARARQAATEQAIQQARQLLAHEKGEESLATLLSAMERDPASASLRTALDSTRRQIATQQAQRKRISKERASEEQKEQVRLSKEQATAGTDTKVPAVPPAASTPPTVLLAAQPGAAAPSHAAPVSLLRRPPLIAGVAASLALLAVGTYFALRTIRVPVPMLQITITKNPADATLTVDGQVKDCPANCTLQLNPGDHTLTLAHAGYATQQSTLTLARTDNNRVATLTLEPAPGGPPPTVPTPAGASLAILGNLGPAAVTLDGKPSGDLASGRLNLSQLAPGSHQVVIARGRQDLLLSVRVARDGSIALDNATGLDEDSVLAAMQSGPNQILFCRCNGAELRMGGRKIKSSGHNTYRIPTPTQSQLNLTLVRAGQNQNIVLQAAAPQQVTILIQPPAPAELATNQQSQSRPLAPAPNQPAPGSSAQIPALDKSASPAPAPPPGPAAPAPDVAAWNSISNSNDLDALRDFRARFPSSPYARVAYQKMESLSWNSIRDSAQPADLQQFLRDYPDSPHASEAKQRIATLQAKSQQQQSAQQDEKQILAALETYAAAYHAKDLNGLSNVWLTAPRTDLQKTFKVADRIDVTLNPSTPSISGDAATVSCEQRIVIVIHHQSFPNNATVVFSLSKLQGRWVIQSVK